uniref:Uncharacterized protein n=1 Tax=Lactuca sativa TaxID=4236 RepID=A0A9R1VB33_LACSA|nr:hypothetical protein LSAT_V11C600314310 [Lactuca sativa]
MGSHNGIKKIQICSSLAILKSKQILEVKYQAAHETSLKDHEMQQPGRVLTVEKLKQHVSNYRIMAGTRSPQFMTACSATTFAFGVICALSTCLFILSIVLLGFAKVGDHKSDYKWSVLVILMIQLFGALLGTIVPVTRRFATLRLKLSVKWILKQVTVPLISSSHNCKTVIKHLKILSLIILIRFQKSVVIACKMIAVIPIFFVICFLYCVRCWKWLKAMFSASSIMLAENPEDQPGKDKDLRWYVLHLEDNIRPRTFKKSSSLAFEKVAGFLLLAIF